MNVLTRALIEAKLKVTSEKLVLCGVAARRQYGIASGVGEFKPDNLPLVGLTVLPARSKRRFTRSAAEDRIVLEPARSQFFFRRSDDRFGIEPRYGLRDRLGRYLTFSPDRRLNLL